MNQPHSRHRDEWRPEIPVFFNQRGFMGLPQELQQIIFASDNDQYQ
jgi:hypothetical protein